MCARARSCGQWTEAEWSWVGQLSRQRTGDQVNKAQTEDKEQDQEQDKQEDKQEETDGRIFREAVDAFEHGPWHGHAGLKFTGSPKGKA